MRIGQGVRTGLEHGGITCVLQTQFSVFFVFFFWRKQDIIKKLSILEFDLMHCFTSRGYFQILRITSCVIH